MKRVVLLAALAVALAATAGCAKYWSYRADDFAETFDIGLTISKEPHWVFYQSFESIFAFGAGNYEADYYGWGGGHFGRTKHYLKAKGRLLWADEEVGWGEYDKDDPSTLYVQKVGLIGTFVGFTNNISNPHYVPT